MTGGTLTCKAWLTDMPPKFMALTLSARLQCASRTSAVRGRKSALLLPIALATRAAFR